MEKYNIDDVYKAAGEAITDRLLAVMTEEGVVRWFYQPVPALGNKKPCDLCSTKELEQLVNRLESNLRFQS